MVNRFLNNLLTRDKALRQQFLTRAAVFIAVAAFIQSLVYRYVTINPRTQWVPGAMLGVTAIALVVYVLARRGYLLIGALLLLSAVLYTTFVRSTPDGCDINNTDRNCQFCIWYRNCIYFNSYLNCRYYCCVFFLELNK